jgi:hypothetical protein
MKAKGMDVLDDELRKRIAAGVRQTRSLIDARGV